MEYVRLTETNPKLFDNTNALIQIILSPKEIDDWKQERKNNLIQKSLPEEWADIGIVFDDPRIVILRDFVEFPGGYRNGYIRIYNRAYLEGGAAGVVMLPEKDGKLLLIQHYRHATRTRHWEIPRGFGKPGTDAVTQATAELEEEIGGKVKEFVELGTFYNNTGLEGHPVNLFLVHMESIGEMSAEEGIENPRWVSVNELEGMIAREEIDDGFTIAAYTRAKLKGLI